MPDTSDFFPKENLITTMANEDCHPINISSIKSVGDSTDFRQDADDGSVIWRDFFFDVNSGTSARYVKPCETCDIIGEFYDQNTGAMIRSIRIAHDDQEATLSQFTDYHIGNEYVAENGDTITLNCENMYHGVDNINYYLSF